MFSYLVLRGKCRYCGAKISIQYPLVELANGILYVLVVAICGLNPDSILWCVLTSIMIVIAVTDLKTMKFPTVCEILMIVVGVVHLFFHASQWLYYIAGALFMGVFLLAQTFKIIKYINQGKLEGGEIFDYILNLLPKMFVETAPLSVLLAGLITISIMASNLEIVSLKTSGIRFLRIVRAPLIIAFVISLFVFFVNNSIYTK